MFVVFFAGRRFGFLLLLVAVIAPLLSFSTAATAEAQGVSCEQVSYNERIILKCSTETAGSDNSSSSPATSPTPTAIPVSAFDDAAGARASDTRSASGTSEEASTSRSKPDSRVDRGNRGSRRGVDQPDPDPLLAAGGSDEDRDGEAAEAATAAAVIDAETDRSDRYAKPNKRGYADEVLGVTDDAAGRVIRAASQSNDGVVLSIWVGILAMGLMTFLFVLVSRKPEPARLNYFG